MTSTDKLPAALRKALIDRFPDFDVYQLGKYNKDKKGARVRLMQRLTDVCAGAEGDCVTLKYMIRMLHIDQPKLAVMQILGKRYPATASEFATMGIPGEFNEELAGKRMRLPIPETWETQVRCRCVSFPQRGR